MVTKKKEVTDEVKVKKPKSDKEVIQKVLEKNLGVKKTKVPKVTKAPEKPVTKPNKKQAALPLSACEPSDIKPVKERKQVAKGTTISDIAESLISSHEKIGDTSTEECPFEPPYETKKEVKPTSSRKGISIQDLMKKTTEVQTKSPLDGFFIPRK